MPVSKTTTPAAAAAPVVDPPDLDVLEVPAADTIKTHVVPPHRTLAEIPAKMTRLREIAQTIRADMADDVARMDGAPLTGRVVAEIHADLAAAIVGLANCVEALAEVNT